jgi:hypothetical protein
MEIACFWKKDKLDKKSVLCWNKLEDQGETILEATLKAG